ncbi:MAG: hypothetical protein ACFB4J_05250 [Elainellaceae cyanobacterium]
MVEREKRLQVVQAQEEWQAGDRIFYLLHDPRPKLLRRLSGSSTPSRLAIEKLPAVEEIPHPKPPGLDEQPGSLPLPPQAQQTT